ncbi:MAG: ribosome biogenesis GTPase Der [Oscillospiraceae bacterium]|jgi:GTP-binding protein|nr:ribosome biogenesis GTPase Der [Oscillospiraceae bacterium]
MPIVAIVGRPNVGKSHLFNKLVGRRLSIVEDTPGVTRDRLYAECEWNGRAFSLVDTGGIEPRAGDDILVFMRDQARIAIDSADVVVLVCDLRTGVTAADADIAAMLRKSKKPVLLCVNKADNVGFAQSGVYEFYNLGLGDPIPVSALHGHGTGDLLDACVALFPQDSPEEDGAETIRVAIVGKPNVGKSSLLNNLLGEERVIVSERAGTTRDAVDGELTNEYGRFVFTDTAGMRKKSRVEDSIERYSVLRAVMAIERSDVCLVLLDARDGVTEQDTKIAGLAHDSGKPAVIVVNKWDLVEKDDKTLDRAAEEIRRDLAYMTYAPIVFISALTGLRVQKLFENIAHVKTQSERRITTGQLNEMLAEATSRVQPPTDRGKRLKVFYMTQAGIKPPHFVAFCNDAKLFHYSYRRYLENRIREVFGLDGTPIVMTVREKGEEAAQR